MFATFLVMEMHHRFALARPPTVVLFPCRLLALCSGIPVLLSLFHYSFCCPYTALKSSFLFHLTSLPFHSNPSYKTFLPISFSFLLNLAYYLPSSVDQLSVAPESLFILSLDEVSLALYGTSTTNERRRLLAFEHFLMDTFEGERHRSNQGSEIL